MRGGGLLLGIERPSPFGPPTTIGAADAAPQAGTAADRGAPWGVDRAGLQRELAAVTGAGASDCARSSRERRHDAAAPTRRTTATTQRTLHAVRFCFFSSPTSALYSGHGGRRGTKSGGGGRASRGRRERLERQRQLR